MSPGTVFAIVDYKDTYVQGLLLDSVKARIPPELLVLIENVAQLPASTSALLQWQQYESIDFEHSMQHPSTTLSNSYVIRKALIRKHFLATTVSHWLSKHPGSELGKHIQPTIDFELDYAEFMDDALLEAYELKESWARNEGKNMTEKEWWILKPGMSDRGQGIRLFSAEGELTSIFEEWDPDSDNEDEQSPTANGDSARETMDSNANGLLTSQLRHFVAQPYIHPPLLFSAPTSVADRKFHIRTYVVAIGALKVYVYRPMLALFAGATYVSPHEDELVNEQLSSHLTNTCLQSGEREGSVHAFWSLPSQAPDGNSTNWREEVFDQILRTTAEIFEAAARSMSIHFQPLPNAFEIFGLDFLVDSSGTAWLLEINAFPDFAQTGDELKGLVAGLFEEVVDVAVVPFFGLDSVERKEPERLVQVLDIDLGRR